MFFVGHVWQAGCVPLLEFLSHCWWFHVHVGCLHMLTLPLRSFVRFPFLLVNFLARFPKVGCETNTSRLCLVAILMAKSQCLLLNGPVMLKIPLASHPWPGTCVLSFWVDIWPADPAWGRVQKLRVWPAKIIGLCFYPAQNLGLSPWLSTEGLYGAWPQAWDRPRISVVKFTVVHPKMRTWPLDPSRLVLETCVLSLWKINLNHCILHITWAHTGIVPGTWFFIQAAWLMDY